MGVEQPEANQMHSAFGGEEHFIATTRRELGQLITTSVGEVLEAPVHSVVEGVTDLINAFKPGAIESRQAPKTSRAKVIPSSRTRGQ